MKNTTRTTTTQKYNTPVQREVEFINQTSQYMEKYNTKLYNTRARSTCR